MCDICDAMGQRVEADGSITKVGRRKSDGEILAAFLSRPDFSSSPRSPRDCLPVNLPAAAVAEVLRMLAAGQLKFDGYGFYFVDGEEIVQVNFS